MLFTKLASSEDPMVFFVISQLFDAVDYSNYVFWVSETLLLCCLPFVIFSAHSFPNTAITTDGLID